MSQRETGREMGRKAGRERAKTIQRDMRNSFKWAKDLMPDIKDMNLEEELIRCDRRRLACEPDYAKFPEMKGLMERHIGEREGFIESGMTETECAYNYSWSFLFWRQLTPRYVSYWEKLPMQMCTNVFFSEGAEGVTISDNRDDIIRPSYADGLKNFRISPMPDSNEIHWIQGGASSAIAMDEEPECSFPCSPFELLSKDCLNNVKDIIEFMTRYREFWGPGNMIWVDKKLNAVAVEKSNCRVAYRYPKNAGAVCTTACSYLDDELHNFKQDCLRKIMKLKGETEETSLDWNYDMGAYLRNKRLLELTNKEAKKPGGATLWGAFNIVADEDVPYPDRICLAGQKTIPEHPEWEINANWTLTQYGAVITGPDRRALYRSVQDIENLKPITSYKPKLVLGEGVKMKPEWQADVDSGRCALDNGK